MCHGVFECVWTGHPRTGWGTLDVRFNSQDASVAFRRTGLRRVLGFVERLLSTRDLLGIADGLVGLPFIAKAVVVGQRASRFFNAAFHHFCFATHDGLHFREMVEKRFVTVVAQNIRDALMALVAGSRSGCGLLHGRIRSWRREARRDGRRGARGLRVTAGGSRSAAGARRDVARLLRWLAAVIRNLLVATIAVTIVAVLAATVVSVMSVTVTASGLGIGGTKNQSEHCG